MNGNWGPGVVFLLVVTANLGIVPLRRGCCRFIAAVAVVAAAADPHNPVRLGRNFLPSLVQGDWFDWSFSLA